MTKSPLLSFIHLREENLPLPFCTEKCHEETKIFFVKCWVCRPVPGDYGVAGVIRAPEPEFSAAAEAGAAVRVDREPVAHLVVPLVPAPVDPPRRVVLVERNREQKSVLNTPEQKKGPLWIFAVCQIHRTAAFSVSSQPRPKTPHSNAQMWAGLKLEV